MVAEIQQIVGKLTAQELDLLQDRFGFDLRNPDVIEASETYGETRRRIQAIEEKALRKIREQQEGDPHCSFCDGVPEEVGKLCRSSRGPYICLSCAQTVINSLESEGKSDA